MKYNVRVFAPFGGHGEISQKKDGVNEKPGRCFDRFGRANHHEHRIIQSKYDDGSSVSAYSHIADRSKVYFLSRDGQGFSRPLPAPAAN